MESKGKWKKNNKKNQNNNAKKEDSVFPYAFLGLSVEKEECIYKMKNAAIKAVTDFQNFSNDFVSEDIIKLIKGDQPSNLNENGIQIQKNNITWKFPKSFHITTLFHSKNYNKNHEALKAFVYGKKVFISIQGFAIIPNGIATFIALTDEVVDNVYPHITFMVGKYKPKQSNDLLHALFDEGCPFYEQYQNILKGEKKLLTDHCKIMIAQNEEEVYLELFEEPLDLEGVMKGFRN